MFKSTAILLVAGLATTASAEFLQGRDMQSISTTTTVNTNMTTPARGLRFYGDSPRINFASTLGCGACIRGGYSFCVPTNVAGADPVTYPAGKRAQCCRDDACVTTVLRDTTARWSCSTRNFSDSTLALGMCPFESRKCGGINSTISFNA